MLSAALFGTTIAVIPLVHFVAAPGTRTALFYLIAVAFGASFGAVYARFQDLTWSLLPPGVDIANAMGFAATCKLAGVGIGNFIAGVILDYFHDRDSGTYQLT